MSDWTPAEDATLRKVPADRRTAIDRPRLEKQSPRAVPSGPCENRTSNEGRGHGEGFRVGGCAMRPLFFVLAIGGLAATFVEANSHNVLLSYDAAVAGLVGIVLLACVRGDA